MKFHTVSGDVSDIPNFSTTKMKKLQHCDVVQNWTTAFLGTFMSSNIRKTATSRVKRYDAEKSKESITLNNE